MPLRLDALFFVACLFIGGCSFAPIAGTDIASETFMIPAVDPGIQLHVRNKHQVGREAFPSDRILLMVHGATVPSESAFDIELPGGSWMEFAARRGFDVYFLDVRGYGRSTRPAAMDLPPEGSPPFGGTAEAVSDVASVVEFILKRRSVRSLSLLGWSWGTALMGGYAASNPEKVEKLVLYAPMWHPWRAPKYAGAYRTAALANREASIPAGRLEEIFPAAWFKKWQAATFATDAVGASRNPPFVRAPNGVLKDMAESWAAGKATYEPSAIRAPTLLVVGEWDRTTPPAMAQELFKQLAAAKYRRLEILPEGSHQMLLQKNRMHLIREVQHFLEQSQ
jgi:pimeloyl-ACP methyl ester carboxylesterase